VKENFLDEKRLLVRATSLLILLIDLADEAA
jgi:hypothetical protein